MSGLWGIRPAAAAAGAAAVGAGVTHAYHSSGASRPRRRSNQATFVVERGRDKSARAKRLVSSDAADAAAVSETAASGARAVATTATFPVASRAHVRGVLYDADGEPVVIDARARFGAKALFLSSLASSALAVAVTRALAARDARHDEYTHDVASEASHDLEEIARGIAGAAAAGAAGAGPSGRDVSSLPNRSTNPRDAAESAPNPPKASDAVRPLGASRERGHLDAAPDTAPLTRELRALMEASPCQSPLDSDLDAEGDWMGSVVSSASPFETPARQALGALRDTQRAAAHAGAPFAEEAVREMERIVARAARSAAASASVSACASGAATPLSRTRPALPRPDAAPRVQALVSAPEKRDDETDAEAATAATKPGKRLSEAETASAPMQKQDAAAPETPSPAAAPAPKLPSRARSSSASPRDDLLREPLPREDAERLAEREMEDERARSASEATDAARDRVRVAEERFRVARERLAEASSVASRSRASSAMPTPRGGAEELRDAAAPRVSPGDEGDENENENENAPFKKADAAAEVREMAEKARAALARSRLASERVAAAAERAARDADAEASHVREEWARRLARSPRATPGEAGTEGGFKDIAVPADRWASVDEVRGKTDVLDRFMGALADARAPSDAGVGERDEARETPRGSAAAKQEETSASAAASAAKPATSLGVLSVSLLGDPREGETLTLRVDAAALPPDCGPVTLRWQRGATPTPGNAGGSNPGTPRSCAGSSAPPVFKTILGARRASYTLTKADVGCVVRAVAAAGDANAGGNVFGSAETHGAVAAREW